MPTKKSLFVIVAFAVAFSVANACAQNANNQESANSVPPRIATNQADPEWLELLQASISIDQPSGSVAQFVESIRKNSPHLNIVVTETAGAHRLPDIKLVKVPIRGSLSLLSTLTNNDVQVNFQSQEEGSDANIILISGDEGRNMDNVLTVRVINVKRLLQAANREALLSALDEGYRLLESQASPVEIKIHEATGLLFVKGTPAQLQMAESVVQEIERGFAVSPNGNPFGQTPTLEGEKSAPKEGSVK